MWVDGQWGWDADAWKWLPGAWMRPPPNAAFTPWTAARVPDGRLFFTPAAWRSRDGRRLGVGLGVDACGAPAALPGAADR